ncbi:MAG: hypothetical protein MUF13_10225 [Akkermansiaceae bacterium]|nr:hypothetical protein [Akkermansiaceae bacterium]
MISKATRSILLAALLAEGGISALCGQFVPPSEGPVAFRRDRIPLDADAMSGLAKQLEILARGLSAETPEDRRGAAQMLALAMALDPGNGPARQLLNAYQAGTHTADAANDQLERGRARLWQNIAWLETAEAGPEAQALAACLKDVIIISDPKHPKATAIREAGEKGKWAGWVATADAFKPKNTDSNLAETMIPSNPLDPSDPPDKPDPGTDAISIKLTEAKVTTLLWQKSGVGESAVWNLAPLPLAMSASMAKPNPTTPVDTADGSDDETDDKQGNNGHDPSHDRFAVRVGGPSASGAFDRTNRMLEALLKNQHGTLPRGGRIAIQSPDFEKSWESRKKQSITAAAAVLANSALTGIEPDAIILGQVDETGAYKLPSGFWDQLQSLGKGNGKRLILPADAAPLLPSILALEKPGFFMEYEVLLAADFKQLTEFAAKNPQGTLASPIAKFREIRDKVGTTDVRQYIANSFVRQRLAAVLQEAPNHISAKMLLIQAAGNRPTLVARSVLAAELRRAIAPIHWLYTTQEYQYTSSDLEKVSSAYESSRSKVDALLRYAEKNDRLLVENTQEMVIAIRNIDRAGRARGEDYIVRNNVSSALKNFKKLYAKVVSELAIEVGEEPPELKQ